MSRTAPRPRIAAIVLAAGMSSRMGRNKLLLEIGGKPILRIVVEGALEAGLDPVLVVLGHRREQSASALAGLSYRPVENLEYEAGMTSSLRAGVATLDEDVSAAVMLLADMPLVSSEMMAAIVDDQRSRGSLLVLSEYGEGGVHAPPTLFARKLFPEILALPDDRCPRAVVKRHFAESSILKWPAKCLKDLDRPGDLESLANDSDAR